MTIYPIFVGDGKNNKLEGRIEGRTNHNIALIVENLKSILIDF